MTNDLLFNGKTEEAIEQYLEHRANVPIAQNLYRHHRYMPDMNRDLYADPRIDAALNDRARQVAEVREEVVAMLQTEEWAR